MIRLLQAPWMVSVIGSVLYLATTVVLIHPSKLEGARPHEAPASKTLSAGLEPSWYFRNPEFEQLVDELKQEKEALRAREQMLHDLEARLKVERQEILGVTQEVARLQKEFDQNVVRLKEVEVANLKKLAKLHAAMSPEGSVKIFMELPDEEVVKVMAYMKVDEVGPVLDAMSKAGKPQAQRAALLADRLRKTIPASGAKAS